MPTGGQDAATWPGPPSVRVSGPLAGPTPRRSSTWWARSRRGRRQPAVGARAAAPALRGRSAGPQRAAAARRRAGRRRAPRSHRPGGRARGEMVVHPAYRRRAWASRSGARWPPPRATGGCGCGLTAICRVRPGWPPRQGSSGPGRSTRSALLAEPLDPPRLPDGITVRTFVPGQDDEAWLEPEPEGVRPAPEQGAWTGQTLTCASGSPGSTRRLLPRRAGRAGWLDFTGRRSHGRTAAAPHGHEAIGEVYVVGVDPDERGTGLGRALTLVGLRHLRDRGLPQVMLYADEDNDARYRALRITWLRTSGDRCHVFSPRCDQSRPKG